MTVKIITYDFPYSFTDKMVKGPFKFMKHKHEFQRIDDGSCTMKDTFEFASPLGIIGRIVDKLILRNYMSKFIIERNRFIKEYAENEPIIKL